jgi:hypothetical protein
MPTTLKKTRGAVFQLTDCSAIEDCRDLSYSFKNAFREDSSSFRMENYQKYT